MPEQTHSLRQVSFRARQFVEWEPDPRHSDIMIASLGFAKGVKVGSHSWSRTSSWVGRGLVEHAGAGALSWQCHALRVPCPESDHAGCLKTRKSTSCTVAFYGEHM
eukprot:5678810-Pyramimonas_sp.AAC.1